MRLIRMSPSDSRFIKYSAQFQREGFQLLHMLIVKQLRNSLDFDSEFCEFKCIKRDPNVTELYSAIDVDEDTIAVDGFTMDNAGIVDRFGKAIYFSDKIQYSDTFYSKSSMKRYKGLRYIYLCSVMLGKIKVYPRNHYNCNTNFPPEDRDSYGAVTKYDSVCGTPHSSTIYAVYRNKRIRVNYVAYLKKNPIQEMPDDSYLYDMMNHGVNIFLDSNIEVNPHF